MVIGVDRLSHILTVLGATPVVKNGRGPVSATFIAPSDGGKSQLLSSHQPPKARVVNDFTFQSLCAMMAEARPPRWIIVPDLNQAISHRPTVANLTMSFLLSLLGEGVTEIPGVETGSPKLRAAIAKTRGRGLTVAILTGMTPEMFFATRGRWRNTGLLRRLVPLYYCYGKSTQQKIQALIRNGHGTLDYTHRKLNLPRKPIDVTIPDPIAAALEDLSEMITESQLTWKDSRGTQQPLAYAFSVHKTVRTYAQAHAVISGRATVTDEDFKGTKDFAQFIRYDRPERL